LERRHPEIRPWLALGTHLQFELNKTVYEIFD
jgi:hypothetical protein